MSGSIRDEMLKCFPVSNESSDTSITPPLRAATQPIRSKHPPECNLSVQDAYTRYCEDCVGKKLIDPRGSSITLREENFPKLIKLHTKQTETHPAAKAKAKLVLPVLRAGIFNQDKYTWHLTRLDCLFWIPDVITDPDGIYPNKSPRIEGNEVYIKRYAKFGSELKLVFVSIDRSGDRIVITSFLDRPNRRLLRQSVTV